MPAAWQCSKAACSPDSRRRSMRRRHGCSTISESRWSRRATSAAAARWNTTSGEPTRRWTRCVATSRRASGCWTEVARRSSAPPAAAARSRRTTDTCSVTQTRRSPAAAARVGAATRDLCEVIDPAALEVAVAAASEGQECDARAGPRRLAGALLATAWAAIVDGGQGRSTVACRRLRTRGDARPDSLLRLGRHVLDPATGTRARAAHAQARLAARRPADSDRDRQHRLPRAPASGKPRAGSALDRDRRLDPLRLKRILSDVERPCDACRRTLRVARCARHSAAGTLLRQDIEQWLRSIGHGGDESAPRSHSARRLASDDDVARGARRRQSVHRSSCARTTSMWKPHASSR